jgi:hypothetical protein
MALIVSGGFLTMIESEALLQHHPRQDRPVLIALAVHVRQVGVYSKRT